MPRVEVRKQCRLGGALAPLLFGLAVAGCGANVVLSQRPGAFTGTMGDLQRCDPGQAQCTNAATYDTSIFNSANTTFVALPNCRFGIDSIFIQNSGSSSATAYVKCAAPGQQTTPAADGGIPTAALSAH